MSLKSRSIWMICGDDNTKFFQAFSKGRKQQNTIWELRNSVHEPVTNFEAMEDIGKEYFENIFKEDQQDTIAEVIQTARYFPKIISDEYNANLMESVSKDELKTIFHSFQKDKILGPDGWTIEFFLVSYDTTGLYFLHLVNESLQNGLVHPPVNSTFLARIPKSKNPVNLEDFRPISLCNITYKVSAQQLKKVLLNIISP